VSFASGRRHQMVGYSSVRDTIDRMGFSLDGAFTSHVSVLGASTVSTANLACAYLFRTWVPIVVTKLGTLNGTISGSPNWDVAIYDSGWNRLVSTGGTAQSGASAFQMADVTDTTLKAGLYYIAGVSDTTTGSQHRVTNAVQTAAKQWGMFQMAAAYPLPDPFTPATVGATRYMIPAIEWERADL